MSKTRYFFPGRASTSPGRDGTGSVADACPAPTHRGDESEVDAMFTANLIRLSDWLTGSPINLAIAGHA